jgi:hypothetical protein
MNLLDPETIQQIIAAADGPTARTKHEIVGFLDDIAICKAYHKPPFEDARFTGVILRDGEWKHTSRYNASADTAMLDTLGCKHDDGGNSRFGRFAARMLNLQTP